MKEKNNNKYLLLITFLLLSSLIFISSGVVAITLNADEITYTPNNSKFNAKNAKQALDTLYTMTENNAVANLLVNMSSKYGTGNNSSITANPIQVDGYETVLFGFQNLTLTGALHVADIYADNNSLRAGSEHGTSIYGNWVQFLVKTGTEYIVEDYDMSLSIPSGQVIEKEKSGYRLVGVAFHVSNYSSGVTGNITHSVATTLSLDTQKVTLHNGLQINTSSMKCTAKLLYLKK